IYAPARAGLTRRQKAMLLPMAKVQIIGTKRCQDATTRILQRLGILQLDEWSERRALSQQRMTPDDEMLRARQRLVQALTRVETVLTALPILDVPLSSDYAALCEHPADALVEAINGDLERISTQAQALASRHRALEEQLASLARYEATLQQLVPLVPAIVDLEHFAMTAIWVEQRFGEVLDIVTRQLEELTAGQCEVITGEVTHDVRAAVLVFPKSATSVVNELLGRQNVAQIRLPAEFTGQPLEKALADIHRRLQAIPRELAGIETEQQALARAVRGRLLAWQALLNDHLALIDAQNHFGQTDYTFVIEGWMPQRELPALEAALQAEIGDEVIVTELPLSADERGRAPVMFDNPGAVKPFEPLLSLLGLPRYGTFDPTPLMAVFLPLFFGMILGDIAYGAILLGVMIYLRRRFRQRPMLRALAEVLIMGSVWSIVFGFIYGEFLGTVGEELGLHPLWFDRGPENLERLFLLTIGIGAGHVVLGLSLGLWSAWSRRSRHELLEKAAMLAALAALFLLAGVVAHFLPPFMFTPALAGLLVGLAILIYSQGGMGVLLAPLELLSTVGNILSYLRIAAIGLSSVYLAQVAGALAGATGSLWVGVIIASFFHALNVLLGAFSPTIHSLRLHYVEFFSKFYEGGGQAFRPFARSVMHHRPRRHAPGAP
ncbi:MAG: hypothetical protein N2204_09365, partial [Anaerolineae bacterium]|nr:hypothetical protein [Anaerolineae bacterium]